MVHMALWEHRQYMQVVGCPDFDALCHLCLLLVDSESVGSAA